MAATQQGESVILERWWSSWFDRPMQVCSSHERQAMPGLLDDHEVSQLRSASQVDFDGRFVAAMTKRHMGAVAMADRQLRTDGDLRLTVMAHAIRHEQQGEIALMHGASGIQAVRQAFDNMFADNINAAVSTR
jgi:uncharacterized protein (DUF305 family)